MLVNSYSLSFLILLFIAMQMRSIIMHDMHDATIIKSDINDMSSAMNSIVQFISLPPFNSKEICWEEVPGYRARQR